MENIVKEVRGHKIIELSGNVDFQHVEELRRFLNKFIKKNIPSIIFDLSQLEHIDSSGIGLFVTIQKIMNKYGGKVGLLNVNKSTIEMLKLAEIDSLLKIYKSPDEIEYR